MQHHLFIFRSHLVKKETKKMCRYLFPILRVFLRNNGMDAMTLYDFKLGLNESKSHNSCYYVLATSHCPVELHMFKWCSQFKYDDRNSRSVTSVMDERFHSLPRLLKKYYTKTLNITYKQIEETLHRRPLMKFYTLTYKSGNLDRVGFFMHWLANKNKIAWHSARKWL